MGKVGQANGYFMSSGEMNVSGIALSSVIFHGGIYKSIDLDVRDCEIVNVMCWLRGNSSLATQNVDFAFYSTPNGLHWSTSGTPHATVTVAMNTSCYVYQPELIDVRGVHTLRLGHIVNTSLSSTVSNLNVAFGKQVRL